MRRQARSRRSMFVVAVVVMLAALSFAQDAGRPRVAEAATVLFSDNFDAETTGLSKTALANWNVTRGSIDVIGNGFWDFYPGNGHYIDISGTPAFGKIESKQTFNLSPGTYTLKFKIGNNPDFGTNNSVLVSLGSAFSKSYSRQGSVPLSQITEQISVTAAGSAKLIFDNTGPSDFTGIIIDEVVLEGEGCPINGTAVGIAAAGCPSLTATNVRTRAPASAVRIGDAIQYSGKDWDKKGGAITVTFNGRTLRTFPASETFTGAFTVGGLDSECKGTLEAKQGSTTKQVVLTAQKEERILAVSGLVQAKGGTTTRRLAAGDYVCDGENVTAMPNAGFVAKNLLELGDKKYAGYRAESPGQGIHLWGFTATHVDLVVGPNILSVDTGEGGLRGSVLALYDRFLGISPENTFTESCVNRHHPARSDGPWLSDHSLSFTNTTGWTIPIIVKGDVRITGRFTPSVHRGTTLGSIQASGDVIVTGPVRSQDTIGSGEKHINTFVGGRLRLGTPQTLIVCPPN